MTSFFRLTVVTTIVLSLISSIGIVVASSQLTLFSPEAIEKVVISPEELQVQRDHDWLLIDVRPQKEFERFHLRNSLNIPIHVLKTKPFLKNRNVVLINARHHYLLVATAIALQQFGFSNTKVLQGGLLGWKKQGGDLEGDYFSYQYLDELPTREYQLLKHEGSWQIFVLTNQRATDTSVFGTIAQIHITSDVDVIIKSIEQPNENSIITDYDILIVTEDGRGYQNIRRLLEGSKAPMVYYLQGGVKGYEKYIQEQATLNKPQGEKHPLCGTCS